ncbi:MAG: hypothetical protein L3J71_05995 [Victivallaceae bacterium]|nr:hypothetical protein [Victivallaceae bacterium]
MRKRSTPRTKWYSKRFLSSSGTNNESLNFMVSPFAYQLVLKAQNSIAWGKTPGNIQKKNIALKERNKVSVEQPCSFTPFKKDSTDKNNQGIALIAVLGILLLITLLTLSIITVSKICALRTAGNNINERSMLLAEGAVNRIYWILMSDRKNFKNRLMGETDYTAEETKRLMADGVIHELDYYNGKAEFSIYDMQSGLQVNGRSPGRELNQQLNQPLITESRKNELEIFRNRLLDYTDSDSLIRLDSLEAGDYSELDMSPLPRNRAMEFREEVLYIPGKKDFFTIDKIGRLSSVALIAPRGLRQPNIRKPNIFNSSEKTITATANLSAGESETVTAALNAWYKQKTPLSESLDALLLSKLKQYFSFAESGYYTIIVRASSNPEFRGIPLAVSIRITETIPLSGRNFYEWTLY